MNSKLILPIVLAFSTVWMVQWYFGKKTERVDQQGVVNVGQVHELQGGVVRVMRAEDRVKPLHFEVDFDAQKISTDEQVEIVETDHVIATFTSFGGLLKEITFKDYKGQHKKPLKTVTDQGVYDQSNAVKHCFLLALENNTPYYYRLVDRISDAFKDVLTYQTENNGWIIKKIYSLYHATYQIDVSMSFEPKSSQAETSIKPRLFFVAPFVHELGAEDAVVPFRLNEESNSIEKTDFCKINDCAWYWTTPHVIFGIENRYFAHTLVNDSEKFVQRAYFNQMLSGDSKIQNRPVAILEGPELLANQGAAAWSMSFYIGPKVHDQLVLVDKRLQDLLSFGWLSALCTLMLQLLTYLYNLLGNYGLAIIALTIIVKIPFVPLSFFSRRKMDEYQKHQPHINRIRMKYKNDAKVQQHEILRYHREHDLSPATPVIGCLPLLIQVPILLSLYRVLWSYLDLYQAPFFGWIVDLSAKDPFYVLPVLMGVTMIWQQSMTAVQDEKQRVISWFMGIVMTVVFASFPAGLVLYWLTNNVLTLVEDYSRKALTRS